MQRTKEPLLPATGIYEVEHRLLHASGSYRWMLSYAHPQRDNSGAILKWYGTTEDIHERKAAEAELRTSEKRYRAVFERGPVGITHISPEGRWTLVNQALCQMLGYSEAELLGKSYLEFNHPDERTRDVRTAEALSAGEIPLIRREKRYIRKDGSVAWVALAASLIRDDVGRLAHRIAVVEDISARKAAEAQLR